MADFGLALSTLPGRVVSTVRRPQGDAYYSSPEMLMGFKPDARSDLFALGVVMLELATGKNLLYAPDGVPESVKATLSRSRRARVERAIKRNVALCKLLARSRSECFQTAGEAADALRGWLGSSFGAKEAADELATIAEEGAELWATSRA